MKKYIFIALIASSMLLSGCNRNKSSVGVAPDPSGLPVGVYDQTNFNQSVWG
jgi:hypothetical protein